MKCPKCNITLDVQNRSGIEIDICTECRGIWLERGELNKILERESRQENYDSDDDYYRNGHHKSYKRKSFLGELFD